MNRYVEAMAREMCEFRGIPDDELAPDELNRPAGTTMVQEMSGEAGLVLAALIATLRGDPQAVDAVMSRLGFKHWTDQDTPAVRATIKAICDYLERDDA